MSLIGSVARLGAALGTVYAVKKVYDRYVQENPEGVEGMEAKTAAYKQAAKDVYADTVAGLKGKAPESTEKATEAVKSFTAKAAEMFSGFAAKAPEYAEKFGAGATKFAEAVEEKVTAFAETVDAEITRAFQDDTAEDAVDVEATVEDAETFAEDAEKSAEE